MLNSFKNRANALKTLTLALLCVPMMSHAIDLNGRFIVTQNDGTTYAVRLEINASGASQLGTANFVMSFNTADLEINSGGGLTSGTHFTPLNFTNATDADYSNMTITRPGVGLLSINIELNNDNQGTSIGTGVTWTNMVEIEFDILDPNGNSNLQWEEAHGVWALFEGDNATQFTNGTFTDLNTTPLPVTLTYFDAVPENETDAKLDWQTATEENNRGFYIERSVDGKNWEVINFTPTQAPGGNSDILVDYQYVDANVYNAWTGISTYYYRLRQQDFNGDEEFVGGIKAVRFGEEGAVSLVSTYPNPASGVINITVKDGAPMQYNVIDMSGRIVMRGNYSPSIDVSRLQSGTYQLIVTDITGARLGTQNISIAR